MSPYNSDPSLLVVEGLDDVIVAIDAMHYVAATAEPAHAELLAITTTELENLRNMFELADSLPIYKSETSAQLSQTASIDVIAALMCAAAAPNALLALMADDAFKEYSEQIV